MSNKESNKDNKINEHKALVLFASETDKDIYSEIIKILEKNKINYSLRIASAHKTPELVQQILDEEDFDVVITGAGLAAALPGVIAAVTLKPVIGVPCKGSYEGLDALLSIIQMPPGIPVLAVGINNHSSAANNAIRMLKQYEYVNIIGYSDSKPVKRAIDMMQQFDNKFKVSDNSNLSNSNSIDKDAVNIRFVELGETIKHEDALVIYCAVSEDDKAEAALNLLKMTEHGLWVGLNRGDNAAVAALEIINLDERHDEVFSYYRESLKKKIVETDNSVKANSSGKKGKKDKKKNKNKKKKIVK
ncbi:TPA: AIR carboxylase family protein [Candidatus Woesearchaeota archaeon]|nr:AIR carboxylase family protein [Candidatus Woesearchaeota archaeon]